MLLVGMPWCVWYRNPGNPGIPRNHKMTKQWDMTLEDLTFATLIGDVGIKLEHTKSHTIQLTFQYDGRLAVAPSGIQVITSDGVEVQANSNRWYEFPRDVGAKVTWNGVWQATIHPPHPVVTVDVPRPKTY